MSFLKRSIPLNSVDKALLALDSKNERMVFHVALTLTGEIEPARLNDAVSLAMAAHPTMRSVLRVRRFRHFREERDDINKDILTIHDTEQDRYGSAPLEATTDREGALLQWINQPMDLKQGPPMRVLLLRRSPPHCMVVFTFHHSATDGLRALRFIREVIARYNEESVTDLWPGEDDCACHRRDEVLSLLETSRTKTRHLYLKLIRNLFDRFVLALLSPPARIFHDRCERPSGEISLLRHTIYGTQLSSLSSRARAARVTLNDLLLAYCFRTVEKWNQIHGRRSRKISVMVPVDVGRRSSTHVVSNQVSYISPFTTREDRSDPAVLLRRTAGARASLLRNGGHISMIYFTYLVSFLPLPVLRIVARTLLVTGVYVDSILLTNVGVIWPRPRGEEGQTRLGKSAISEITCIAPVLTPFRMGIVVSAYNGALSISLAYRTCLVSREKARAFLDLYLNEILIDDPVDRATAGSLTASSNC